MARIKTKVFPLKKSYAIESNEIVIKSTNTIGNDQIHKTIASGTRCRQSCGG